MEGNETLTLVFGTRPERVTPGSSTRLVLTVTDDDGPPAAPAELAAATGDGVATLSWEPVANDSPVTRYEVRWRETDGGTFGTWRSAGLETSYRVDGLTNGTEYTFEVRAVNAHGDGGAASAPGTPSQEITAIPTAPQVLRVKAVDSARAELSWGSPSNAFLYGEWKSLSKLQGYRIDVCRGACDDEANWYALVSNTRSFNHRYTHQVLAPGVIRENRYRVRAININGKSGPWSNVAQLDPTVVENFYLQAPDSETLWVRFKVRNPDGNPIHVLCRCQRSDIGGLHGALQRACEQVPEPRSAVTWGALGQAPAGSSIVWYGVHGVEMLQRALGRGARTVSAHPVSAGAVLVVEYAGGATGVVELYEGGGYGGVLRAAPGTDAPPAVPFLAGGPAPVPLADTLEVMAILDAADRVCRSGRTEPTFT